MDSLRERESRVWATGLLFLAMSAQAGAAQCDHTTYAYEDRVAVLGCDKTGAPELEIIVLDDFGPLKITGRVKVDAQRGFDAATHFRNYLMMTIWNKLFVFDLSDPDHPAVAATFTLKKRDEVRGYDRFEQVGENKFLALTAMGAVEITAQGAPEKWSIAEVPLTADLQKKASTKPREWQYVYQDQPTIVLRESGKYRYELGWKEKKSPGEIWHRQYVRQVNPATMRDASVILLGEHLETVD